MKTKKELETKIAILTTGCAKLNKDILELAERFAKTSEIMQDMCGVIMVLKEKGVVTDEEICTTITNQRKKFADEKRIQSEVARAAQDGRGHVGLQLLRETGAGINRRGPGNTIK